MARRITPKYLMSLVMDNAKNPSYETEQRIKRVRAKLNNQDLDARYTAEELRLVGITVEDDSE